MVWPHWISAYPVSSTNIWHTLPSPACLTPLHTCTASVIFVLAFRSCSSSPRISNIIMHCKRFCDICCVFKTFISLFSTVQLEPWVQGHNQCKNSTTMVKCALIGYLVCFLFSKGTFPTIPYQFFPTSTTQKREINLSDGGSFILRQRVRGVRALCSPFISCM